jgi:hypothetical protein
MGQLVPLYTLAEVLTFLNSIADLAEAGLYTLKIQLTRSLKGLGFLDLNPKP